MLVTGTNLNGYTLAPPSKKPRESWIWEHGEPLIRESNLSLVWLCTICHNDDCLLQLSTVHSYFLLLCLPAQTKDFASSTHLPKWSRLQQRIHMSPCPRSQNLSVSCRPPPEDSTLARMASATCLLFTVKTSVDGLIVPLSNRSPSVSPLTHRGAYGSCSPTISSISLRASSSLSSEVND